MISLSLTCSSRYLRVHVPKSVKQNETEICGTNNVNALCFPPFSISKITFFKDNLGYIDVVIDPGSSHNCFNISTSRAMESDMMVLSLMCL